MRAALARAIARLAACGSAVGCSPTVGVECETNRQCGTTLTCDTTIPGGYCIKVGCRAGECPPEATCVDFGDERRYCMRTCAPDDGCREDLTCRAAALCPAVTPTEGPWPCSHDGKSFCGVAQK